MEKPANNDYPINPLIRRRWSPRAFDSRPIPTDKLLSILEAARWAASSRNEQPWHFIIGVKESAQEAYDALLGCLNETNQEWAQSAPVLVLAVARNKFTRFDRENRYAQHDVGMASASMILQAVEYDIFAHMMAGFDAEAARTVCEIPPDYTPVTITALGYLGDPDSLEEKFKEREHGARSRRPLAELIFEGRWDTPAALLDEKK